MYIIILIQTIQFSRDNMHPKKIYPEMLDDAKDAKATFHIARGNIGRNNPSRSETGLKRSSSCPGIPTLV
jgi:hypothetical protein